MIVKGILNCVVSEEALTRCCNFTDIDGDNCVNDCNTENCDHCVLVYDGGGDDDWNRATVASC